VLSPAAGVLATVNSGKLKFVPAVPHSTKEPSAN